MNRKFKKNRINPLRHILLQTRSGYKDRTCNKFFKWRRFPNGMMLLIYNASLPWLFPKI